jgi:hypothetical protein
MVGGVCCVVIVDSYIIQDSTFIDNNVSHSNLVGLFTIRMYNKQIFEWSGGLETLKHVKIKEP